MAETAWRVSFLGLGVMGYPMAGHLARAGHQVRVYNRTPAKAEQWCAEYPGQTAATPAAAAQDAEIILLCVGRDEDVQAVINGKHGVAEGLSADAIVVDHSTTSAQLARDMAAQLKPQGAAFIDAPVSGGQAGAQNGQLTIFCGGDPDAFQRAEPALACYARAVTHLGAAGSGQLAKMVNQICIAGLLQGLAEGIHFGMQAGLDMPKVIAALSKGAAQSWQMENRGLSMIADHYDFGFAVDWLHKDLGYCLDEVERLNVELPVAELVEQFYAELQQMGGGRWDTSSLLRRLQHRD
jgi:3-hydroxyisobutyrate dehydrogenase